MFVVLAVLFAVVSAAPQFFPGLGGLSSLGSSLIGGFPGGFGLGGYPGGGYYGGYPGGYGGYDLGGFGHHHRHHHHRHHHHHGHLFG